MKNVCRRCGETKTWKLKSGKLRCSSCKTTFSPRIAGICVSKQILKQVISEFILEHSTDVILERVNISKYKLLKVLTFFRIAMAKDTAETFTGIVEADETYLGGQMKNRRLKEKAKLEVLKRGRKKLSGHATIKQAVFGILCRNGKVWATLIADTEADDLQPLIENQVVKGSTVCSDTWRGYTGIAAKGYVHRLVKHSEGEYSDGKGNHINGLEGFWGYLKRKLAAKGGIRKEKLPLFLAEYVWRYNYRKLSIQERENRLYDLITGVSY